MKKKFGSSLVLGLAVMFLLGGSAFAADKEIDGLIAKIKANQAQVRDMRADVTTVMRSEMKDKKTLEQKGKLWTKGDKFSRMDVDEPVKQSTITTPDKIAIINSTTGQKMVQDLNKFKQQTGQSDVGSMDQTKAFDYFNLKLIPVKGIMGIKEYILEGTPKKKNKFLGKVAFHIDPEKYVPVKVEIFSPEGKLVSSSNMEYQNVNNVWVLAKSNSEITLPGGKMSSEMRFDNIKVNEGIDDSVFRIE